MSQNSYYIYIGGVMATLATFGKVYSNCYIIMVIGYLYYDICPLSTIHKCIMPSTIGQASM